jgi:hypothetical protein
VPFIVLSCGNDVARLAASVGAVAGFRKPFDASRIMTTVRRIAERGAG